MKGIIFDYFDEKGFGFIKDENEEKRFFHINDLQDRQRFLDNIDEFYYSDEEDRICHVVSFTQAENAKGLCARNIVLTSQVFNDMSLKKTIEVLITDVDYRTDSLTRIITGVKGGAVPAGTTRGGNGTFGQGYPETFRELNLYFRRTDDIGWGSLEVRDLVLKINSRNNITGKLVDTLRNKLTGRKILITPNASSWNLNDHSLLAV